jgi:hypothetical protein
MEATPLPRRTPTIKIKVPRSTVKAIAQTILKNKISPTFYGLMMAD